MNECAAQVSNKSRSPVKNKTWVTDCNGQTWLMKRSQILAADSGEHHENQNE